MIQKYKNEEKVLVAVDCIIFGFDQHDEELKILLIKRNFAPEKGKWSLMGGFLHTDETLRDAAIRILHSLTGLHNVYLEQLKAYSEIDRDPVERTISVTYYALINIEQHDVELIKKYSARWFKMSNYPKLIFDHNEMVKDAIERLRYRATTQPIGFELLPAKFTMRQLQKLYEEIMDEKLDKRNFTKKINSFNILEKLKEKNKRSSKKGSFLYKFNQQKYQQKNKNGFGFKI
ncbi:MAG: NUDIX hydrolase [Cyclobacteriaceae bacterium]|nr:NUDIX hydrolase [Cyclobacteriaceae bacterium]